MSKAPVLCGYGSRNDWVSRSKRRMATTSSQNGSRRKHKLSSLRFAAVGMTHLLREFVEQQTMTPGVKILSQDKRLRLSLYCGNLATGSELLNICKAG